MISLPFFYKPPNSPLVETIWYTQSEGSGSSFISPAFSNMEMVFTRQHDKTTVTIMGPETTARPSPIPVEAEFLGITFKLGAFMPYYPIPKLVNNPIHIPQSTNRTFPLTGDSWELPTFDNVDVFIKRLIRHELLIVDPIVQAVLSGQHVLDVAPRTIQRRFRQATGLTQGSIEQIARANHALELLSQGISIQDTVFEAGYADQPHLTRSLKRFIGQTPAQIITPPE